MRFIFVGDPHGSNTQIDSRTDDYGATFMRKLRFVLQTAADRGIQKVISGGDLFHVPLTSKAYLNELISLLQEFQEQGVFFYTIVGNHNGDAVYKDWTTYLSRDIGTLVLGGALCLVDDLLPDFSPLHAYRYKQDGSYLYPLEDQAEVVIAHYFLNQGYPGDDLVIQYDELKQRYPKMRVFCQAHDHTTYEIKLVEGTLFVAPGSLMRTSFTNSDRQIYLAVVDSEAQTAEYVEVPSEPSSSVFLKEVRDIEKEAEGQLKKFMTSIAEVGAAQAELHEFIVGYVKGIPDKEVRDSMQADFEVLGIL